MQGMWVHWGGASILSWGAKISHAWQPKNKTQNRSNIVTKSMKTLKMVHIKKFQKKKCLSSRSMEHDLRGVRVGQGEHEKRQEVRMEEGEKL